MFVCFILVLISVSINGSSTINTKVQILTDTERFGYCVNSERTFDMDKMDDLSVDVDAEVTFHLFTNADKETGHLLKVGDLVSVRESPFHSEYPTKVIVHGWTDSIYTYWYNTFRNNYLATGNYNVILVDWSSPAHKGYFTSAKLTHPVGQYLGQLLSFLEENANMSLSSLHILGHSLGAHIAGISGSTLSGQVGRITGMDPARPGFEVPFLADPKNRLDPTDAEFVDVIHTCSGTVGFTLPIGHVDFYPNGGTFSQPGCPPLIFQYCSHARSHQFMSESIVQPEGFLSLRCDSWMDFVTERCSPNSETAFMGETVSRNTRGTFYLRTNPQQPFGRAS